MYARPPRRITQRGEIIQSSHMGQRVKSRNLHKKEYLPRSSIRHLIIDPPGYTPDPLFAERFFRSSKLSVIFLSSLLRWVNRILFDYTRLKNGYYVLDFRSRFDFNRFRDVFIIRCIKM